MDTLDQLSINPVGLNSLQTQKTSFRFYFPSEGSFPIYPATLMRSNRFVANTSVPATLKVVSEFSVEDRVVETFQDAI